MEQSPFFSIKYGWPYGSDGWNTGMDENLITLSFLNTHTVDSFVSSLPTEATIGTAYILSSDSQVYIALEGGWFFINLSPGYEFRVSSDNSRWRKTVSGFEQIISVDDTQDQLDDIDQQINGSGGLEDRLGVVEGGIASAKDYTDQALQSPIPVVVEEEVNIPNNCFFVDSVDDVLKFKDAQGIVHVVSLGP